MSTNESNLDIVGEQSQPDGSSFGRGGTIASRRSHYRLGNRLLSELPRASCGRRLAGLDHRQLRREVPGGLLILMAIGIVVAFMNIIRILNRKRRSQCLPSTSLYPARGKVTQLALEPAKPSGLFSSVGAGFWASGVRTAEMRG